MTISEVRHSAWIAPGWYLATCDTCPWKAENVKAFESAEVRDAWAAYHANETGHRVNRIDGTED